MKSQVKAAVSSMLKNIPNDDTEYQIFTSSNQSSIQQTHSQPYQTKVLYHKEIFKLWN